MGNAFAAQQSLRGLEALPVCRSSMLLRAGRAAALDFCLVLLVLNSATSWLLTEVDACCAPPVSEQAALPLSPGLLLRGQLFPLKLTAATQGDVSQDRRTSRSAPGSWVPI